MDLVKHGRVLYVSMADVSQPTGPGVNEREFLLSLYEALGERMHAVLPAPRGDCAELDISRTTLYRNPKRWDLTGFLRQQIELYRVVVGLTKNKRFDLTVVRLSLLPLAFFMFARRQQPIAIKTLGAIQGFTKNRGFKGFVAKTLGPLNGWLFRQIISRAVAVDCCTETHFREHLKDYALPQESLLVVENATNVKRFYPVNVITARAQLGLLQFDRILGFVGGSPAERGGMQMLDVALRLAGDFPKLGIVIVGDDKSNALKRHVDANMLQDRVVLTGLVPYELIPSYVNSFDVGFALDRVERWQLTGNSYQKVRQYLACGKPVITCVDQDSELAQSQLVENVHADDLHTIEATLRRLFARDTEATERFASKVSRYAADHLSTRTTLQRRFQFWGYRLDKVERRWGQVKNPAA